MKIAITGHRPHKLGNDYDLTSPLIQWIENQIFGILVQHSSSMSVKSFMDIKGNDIHTELETNKLNGLTIISGMALGIDTLFAKIAIKYNIPFIAAIPCEGQYSKWPEKSRKVWLELVSNPLCTKHYVSKDNYNHTCMQKRNEWMVDNCDLLIAVWDGSSGGTANCVQYAEFVGREIIRINPNDYK